jgi:hypothetical protein
MPPRKRGDEGDSDTQTKTTNFNLDQGKRVDDLRTSTSYFDKDWNTFTQEKDGSMYWIPEQIVGIGEDFHIQVDDGKVKTTLYKVRWIGYDRTGDAYYYMGTDLTSTGIHLHDTGMCGPITPPVTVCHTENWTTFLFFIKKNPSLVQRW